MTIFPGTSCRVISFMLISLTATVGSASPGLTVDIVVSETATPCAALAAWERREDMFC